VPVVEYLQKPAAWGCHRFPSDATSASKLADKRHGKSWLCLTISHHCIIVTPRSPASRTKLRPSATACLNGKRSVAGSAAPSWEYDGSSIPSLNAFYLGIAFGGWETMPLVSRGDTRTRRNASRGSISRTGRAGPRDPLRTRAQPAASVGARPRNRARKERLVLVCSRLSRPG
jgi:hypothetical protein